MMKKFLKKSKGVTLIALVITVAIILILANVLIYNVSGNLRTTKLTNMQADIENLRDKVSIYYSQYGMIPADTTIEYTNVENIKSISEATDTGAFYVIDLGAMENVSLNYGKDYEKIRNGEATTQEQINSLTDIYIINSTSHNIFYVQGIETDGETFYTDYSEEDKDSVPVEMRDTIKEIKFASASVYILTKDGELWVVGRNEYGELGLGDTTDRNVFQQVDIPKLKHIYANMYCVFAMTEDDEIYAWGENNYGQLGLGDTTNKLLPTKLDITDVKEIYPYWQHNVLMKNDGSIWSAGMNSQGQLGLGDTTNRSTFTKINIDNVKDVKVGTEHTMVLKNDETVWTTGYGGYGALGLGNTSSKTTFTKTSLTDVKQIVNGRCETVVLKNDGTVWGCGYNLRGELGQGNTTQQINFVKIPVENVKEIKCEYSTVLAITNDNKIYGWGMNDHSQIDGKTEEHILSPQEMIIDDWKEIYVAGQGNIFIKKNDNTLWGRGENNFGELGQGNFQEIYTDFVRIDYLKK